MLEKILEDLQNPSEEVQALALSMLERISTEILQKSDFSLLQKLLVYLDSLVDLCQDDLRELVLAAFKRILELFPSQDTELSRLFQTLPSEEWIPFLLKHAANQNLLPDEQIFASLVLCSSWNLKTNLLKILAKRQSPDLFHFIEIFLQSSNTRILSVSLQIIEKFKNKEMILLALPLLFHPGEGIREAARNLISQCDQEEILLSLKELLTSESIPSRKKALFLLQDFCGQKIVDLLHICAYDLQAEIRIRTAQLLSRLKDERIPSLLRRLSEDSDIEVSSAVLKILEKPCEDKELCDFSSIFEVRKESTTPIEVSREEPPQAVLESPVLNTNQIDEMIDAKMISLAKKLYPELKSGIIKDERFLEPVFQLEQRLKKFEEFKSSSQDKKLFKKLTTVLSGNYQSKIEMTKLELAMEDAYLELAETAIELWKEDTFSHDRFQSALKEIEELFFKRKEAHGNSDQ